MRVSKKTVLAELARVYPDAGPELNFSNPYETLVAVMLSAQCTDKQVNKVTPALFERYPDVEAMAAASVEDVYPMVKSCGFKTKASNIVEACRIILHRHGGQVPGDMAALTALPGVGQKTANVVLANAFGVPTIAVDTHVFRVSNRLGLANAKNVEATEEQLKKAIEGEYRDVQIIAFGPFEAPVYRVDNIYRMRMVVKCRLNNRSRAMFEELLVAFASEGRGSNRPVLSIDFNPSSI